MGIGVQMLALVTTLIQLFDYQKSTGKTAPREEWPAALRFYESFGGRENGIPDAPYLFLIPSSILPQFVAEAHRFFRPGAVDIFTIGTAAKSWPADWARFHDSKQKAIRRIVSMGHPTVRNLMSRLGVTYKDRVVFNFKELMPKTAQPFNKDWLTVLIDEGHYAGTGGKLYQAFQAAFETALVRVVATATPMYQNLRDLVYITKLLHSERFKTTAEQKMFEMVGDYTRLRSKTRKTDIAHLTAQFETHRILKVFTADRIIRRTVGGCMRRYGGADVSQAIRDTGRFGGNFFLGARKETVYYGSSEKSTKELQDSEFANLAALNAQLSTKFQCTLLLIQKILTKGAGQFFSEDEIGVNSLVKQDSEMGLSIEGFSFVKINGTDMAGTDKKILLHTEFSFQHNLIVSVGPEAHRHNRHSHFGGVGDSSIQMSDLDRFRTDPEIHVLVMSNVGAARSQHRLLHCADHLHTTECRRMLDGRRYTGTKSPVASIGEVKSDGASCTRWQRIGSIDMALLANGRNKGAMLKSFLSVSRNQAIWKQLNDQADDEDIREIYRDEYNMEMEELVEAKEVGKFKAFSLPGDEGLSDDGAT
ncbi:hypothetical protein B0H13DRAFT_1880375 [Mycena leptocephala]|nr:hypothetical protein B0H13DRAFT_1880375 [Mycena leptocephala]